MKKTKKVWVIFRKVINTKTSFLNNKLQNTYLQFI